MNVDQADGVQCAGDKQAIIQRRAWFLAMGIVDFDIFAQMDFHALAANGAPCARRGGETANMAIEVFGAPRPVNTGFGFFDFMSIAGRTCLRRSFQCAAL